MSEHERRLRNFKDPDAEAEEQPKGLTFPGDRATVLQDAQVEEQPQLPVSQETVSSPAFTVVDIPDSGFSFAKEWRPSMATPNYIGETSMLLEYLKRLERLHKVTMPIKACGIDPILFKNVKYLTAAEVGQSEESEAAEVASKIFSIPPAEAAGGVDSLYELISVDGELYMSCLSECLDSDYLNAVISEATSSVKAFGRYIFQMVGFKKLALEAGQVEGKLLNTLKLNTYEMSVLISYMQQFNGIKVSYRTIDGKQCICFETA